METTLKIRNSNVQQSKLKNPVKIIQKRLQRKTSQNYTYIQEELISKHPFIKFIRGNKPPLDTFKKFAIFFYKELNYSIKYLKGPSQEFIKKKSVSLSEPQNSKQKFLMLDLDQTLIHSIFTKKKADVTLQHKGTVFRFNVRPYCLQFLQKMSQYFTIYIYTASTIDYATPIVEYLNRNKKTIHGILHRKNCMETNSGFFIKDLRIIKNRQLHNIVIVDNLVHSFGLQIENGIPILDFIDNEKDTQLLELEKVLCELHKQKNVKEYLKNKLSLRKMLEIKEEQLIRCLQN